MSQGNPRLVFGRQVFDFFVQRGYSPQQAAAIAGNVAWEGEGRTDAVARGDNYRNSPMAPHSIGIAQWNDRSPALIAFARQNGIDIPQGDLRDANYAQDVIRRIPLQTQLEFMHHEMQGPENRAYRNLMSTTDLRTGTAAAIGYHRPAGWTASNPEAGHGFQGRLGLANDILNMGPPTPVTPQPADGMDAAGYTPRPNAPLNPWTAPPEQLVPPTTPVGGGDPAAIDPNGPIASLLSTLFPGQFGGSQGSEMDQMRQRVQQLEQEKEKQPQQQAADPSGGVQIQAPPQRQLDLTKLRAMLQNRKPLGTMGA